MASILRNNQIIPKAEAAVDINDRGYQFGDGIYEVVRIYQGRPFLFNEHIARLRRCAEDLKIPSESLDEKFQDQLLRLLKAENVSTGTLYIQVTRGVCERRQGLTSPDLPIQTTAYVKPLERPLEALQHGASGHLCPDLRWLRCNIKSINLLPNLMVRQEAIDAGAIEAIQHRDAVITEGAFSNVFLVTRDGILTHPANHLILGGITRSLVFEICNEAGIPIAERTFGVDELSSAQEFFVTSTLFEILPLTRVGKHLIADGRPGPLTRKLQASFEKRISA